MNLWMGLTFVVVLCLDQITKMMAIEHLRLADSIEVFPKFFSLTLVFNKGAAFGMFSNLPEGTRHIALGGVLIVAIAVVFRFMRHEAKGDRVSEIALCAVLAGAVGNLVDRFRFDSVVDFLDFYWGRYHWPAFNIADSAISLGVFFLCLRMLRRGNDVSQVNEGHPAESVRP